eukprot:CAMPEP_0171988186 /NCGR_PEP_ID=MMETSP0993-20121228/275775_1 /TAXON_ID=483369 /ORGANISM="non described non described, Strain CCMP2098" /LENGTH=942 /DNA_ID=CAMNT_0012641153 /DNA_START=369 /DNA_END=3197 /DNA_ORIENTATION=+
MKSMHYVIAWLGLRNHFHFFVMANSRFETCEAGAAFNPPMTIRSRGTVYVFQDNLDLTGGGSRSLHALHRHLLLSSIPSKMCMVNPVFAGGYKDASAFNLSRASWNDIIIAGLGPRDVVVVPELINFSGDAVPDSLEKNGGLIVRWVLGKHDNGHDKHDPRLLHLASTHWIRKAHLAPGPLLDPPLDDEIYAAARTWRRDARVFADHGEEEEEEEEEEEIKEEGRHRSNRLKGDGHAPLVLFDDDTVLDQPFLTALLAHEGRRHRGGGGGGGVPSSASVVVPKLRRLAGLSREDTLTLFQEATVFLDLFLPGKERSGFEALLFGAVSVIADDQNGADREDYPEGHFHRIGFEDEDFAHAFGGELGVDHAKRQLGLGRERRKGGDNGTGLGDEGIAFKCGSSVAAAHAEFTAAKTAAEAPYSSDASVGGGDDDDDGDDDEGIDNSEVVCRHALVARHLATFLFKGHGAKTTASHASATTAHNHHEGTNTLPETASSTDKANNSRSSSGSAVAQLFSLPQRFSETTTSVFSGRHVQLVTAVSTVEDFAWLPALLVSSFAASPLSPVLVLVDPAAVPEGGGGIPSSTATASAHHHCAGDAGGAGEAGEAGGGRGRPSASGFDLSQEAPQRTHWLRSRFGFAAWDFLERLGLLRRVRFVSWQSPTAPPPNAHTNGAGGRWPPSSAVALAALPAWDSTAATPTCGSSSSSSSSGSRLGVSPPAYSFHIPVRSLVTGSAALSCGVRAMEARAKEASLESAPAAAKAGVSKAEDQTNARMSSPPLLSRENKSSTTTWAVPFFAPVQNGGERQSSSSSSGGSGLETVAMLSETAPFAQAVDAMAGDEWEAFAAHVWRAGADCALRESCEHPLLGVPHAAAQPGGNPHMGVRVTLTRPRLAGDGATVVHVGNRRLEIGAIPGPLANHPLWRAATPLFSDEVLWKLRLRQKR